jgi:hypothetical protein
MSNAPYAEPMVPIRTQNETAAAERKHLQNVLDELNPAGGITASNKNPNKVDQKKKNQKRLKRNAAKTDNANTTNPDNQNEDDE